MNSSKGSIVLAFDIEMSGNNPQEFDLLGLGISVIDENKEELEHQLFPCYFPKQTKFEEKCWDEFWSKHEDKLKLLEYKGNKRKEERLKEVITAFQNIRRHWELTASELKNNYNIVSDNNVFDGGIINHYIIKYTKDMPLPYTASEGKYSSFYETSSLFKGFLLATDPEFSLNNEWGFFKKIQEIHNIPKFEREHDHNPANDAYTIACEFQSVMKICKGTPEKKETIEPIMFLLILFTCVSIYFYFILP